jgi:hypothetical protein
MRKGTNERMNERTNEWRIKKRGQEMEVKKPFPFEKLMGAY